MKLLAIFIAMSSCMKLEEHEVLLDNYCDKCQQMLQDSVLKLPGIYFVQYQPASKSIKIKYQKDVIKMPVLHNFLGRHGFLIMGDSLSSKTLRKLKCCE